MMLSIVTIALNNDQSLSNTLNSISQQNIQRYNITIEHIIISPDISCSNYSDKKFYFRPASGIYDAMNFGIYKSQGDFLWFLNSGDTAVDVGLILKEISDFRNSSVDIFGFSVYQGSINEKIYSGRLTSPHQGTIYRSSIFERLKGFDVNMKIHADRDLFDRAREFGYKFHFYNEPIAIFDMTGVSSKKKKFLLRFNDAKYEFKNRPLNIIRLWRLIRHLIG